MIYFNSKVKPVYISEGTSYKPYASHLLSGCIWKHTSFHHCLIIDGGFHETQELKVAKSSFE
jgi:hypothetical protein